MLEVSMRNIWVHSAFVTAMGALALLFAQRLAWPAIELLTSQLSDPGVVQSVISPGVYALSKLVPGLITGWFTKRHPLLVGAAAGLIGTYAFTGTLGATIEAPSRAGLIFESALLFSVAALAGRALRHRFAPSNFSSKPTADAAA